MVSSNFHVVTLLPISFGTFSHCSHAQKSPFPHTIPMVIFSFLKKDSVQFLHVTPIQLELRLVYEVPGYFSQRALSPIQLLGFPRGSSTTLSQVLGSHQGRLQGSAHPVPAAIPSPRCKVLPHPAGNASSFSKVSLLFWTIFPLFTLF